MWKITLSAIQGFSKFRSFHDQYLFIILLIYYCNNNALFKGSWKCSDWWCVSVVFCNQFCILWDLFQNVKSSIIFIYISFNDDCSLYFVSSSRELFTTFGWMQRCADFKCISMFFPQVLPDTGRLEGFASSSPQVVGDNARQCRWAQATTQTTTRKRRFLINCLCVCWTLIQSQKKS